MVMIVLALAGSVLIGNDFRFGSLPFYLSKPLSPLALPARQGPGRRRLHQPDDHAAGPGPVRASTACSTRGTISCDNGHLLVGILGYGAVLTVSLSCCCWRRRSGCGDRAAHHDVDDAVLLLCRLLADGPGGRPALRPALAADRPVERHLRWWAAPAWGSSRTPSTRDAAGLVRGGPGPGRSVPGMSELLDPADCGPWRSCSSGVTQ